MKLSRLRRDITDYIESNRLPGCSPLTMPDLLESALDCERRIELISYLGADRPIWKLDHVSERCVYGYFNLGKREVQHEWTISLSSL